MEFIKSEWKWITGIIGIFLLFFFLPVGTARFDGSVLEAMALLKWYARQHVLLCLVPAFFIAGGLTVFLNKGAVMKYLGANANKFLAYGIASCSGILLAVCSCTVLPLFAGIYKRGAGLGPATAFLYSGPAISVLAIVLTANVLGAEMGTARAVGAIIFSIAIGIIMETVFKEDKQDVAEKPEISEEKSDNTILKNVIFFVSMTGFLIFANWSAPQSGNSAVWALIYSSKWTISSVFIIMLLGTLAAWFKKEEISEWLQSSWEYAKMILPLLFIGVFIAGLLLGGPGSEGLIPSSWVAKAVGGNSVLSNFTASFVGAFMYFATLTEIPIIQGLMHNGMGKGPALALLLAGPALSLPNMLVIRKVLGTKKTAVYISLVVIMATFTGWIYGALF